MITVITPVYNGEKFIESCIKVVINQDCSDVEHIIVDGGSSDRTVDIIKHYVQQYSHLRLISGKDLGQSDAMNKGITLAKGEILAILNVDDYYEPNVLRGVSQIFETLPEPSLLVGNCNVWNEEEELYYINKPAKLTLFELLMGFLVNPFPVNPSAYFYHTSLHREIGLYKVDEHYVMDIDFLLRAVSVATVKYVDETWGNFRQIQGTKTFNDLKNGKTTARLDNLFKKYRKKLSKIQQIQVYIIYKLSQNWHRIRMVGIRSKIKNLSFLYRFHIFQKV